MSNGGKGDDRRPEAERGAYARGFDAIDWGSMARAELKALVEEGMAKHGFPGEASVSSDPDGALNVTFDVLARGRVAVSFGGFITKRRGLRDLAHIGVERMAERCQA